ncbi:hypothetical protein C1H46_004699 [Malus baccata]|uniref:Uncharacterized protein n=1 Tax=Malus baccata TaxID=106549 RepID=A0A540NFD8_MALBA|nr:hypothetical protein C1H46_004699 [Malus baccata]
MTKLERTHHEIADPVHNPIHDPTHSSPPSGLRAKTFNTSRQSTPPCYDDPDVTGHLSISSVTSSSVYYLLDCTTSTGELGAENLRSHEGNFKDCRILSGDGGSGGGISTGCELRSHIRCPFHVIVIRRFGRTAAI